MSVGIGNLYPPEIENENNNPAATLDMRMKPYSPNTETTQNQNSSNNYLRPFLNSNENNTVKEEASLPNVIKDELLELNYVIREYSTKLPSLTTSHSNALIKRVSELVDAYFSHLNIINQQYNYYTNTTNSNNKNDSNTTMNGVTYHHPIITSLINMKEKIDVLLGKLKSGNTTSIKCWFNFNKLNKYFEKLDEEWKNLLLNISVNNLTTSMSNSDAQPKKVAELSKRNKELEENPLEIYITGEKYFYGIGNEKSYTAAFKKYSKAAKYGIPDAMYMLGFMYEKGYGISMDISMAIYWYGEAAKFKFGKAYNSLGNIYENGIGVQRNDKKAYEYYKNGADLGEISCYTSLGQMYENGQYVDENIQQAVYWYQRAAQKNCVKAQLALGKIYYYGMSPNYVNRSSSSINDLSNESKGSIKKNFMEAINLFRKSAEQGEAEAQVYLGLCYENGYGVVKDYVMAKMNFEKASKQNDVLGSLYLGKIYMKEDNINAALNCFLISLSKGSVDALYYIGKLYDKEEEENNGNDNVNNGLLSSCMNTIGYDGLSKSLSSSSYLLPSDKNMALKYYLQAAEKGHSLAQYRLGNHYCLHKKYILALYWYLKSSHLSKSQNALGQFYELGLDSEFKQAATLTGLTLDCLLHYSIEQLYSFYNHFCQMVQTSNNGNASLQNQNNKNNGGDDDYKPHSNLKEAKKWYYRSILQGNADAAFNLGQLYETRCFDFSKLASEDEVENKNKTGKKEKITTDDATADKNQEPVSSRDEFTQPLPTHQLSPEEIAENQSRYIQKAILLYEKAKKLGSKEAAERLKQLQSIAYHQTLSTF